MKKMRFELATTCTTFVQFFVMALFVFAMPFDAVSKTSPGEEAFLTHCAACHDKGGNIVTPGKTLFKKDLAKRGISKPADIVKTMRNPGPMMNKFDEKTIPDKTAKAIAEYILKTFK